MEKLTKDDLAQMNRPYFESLNHESLVNAACNLRDLGVELIERLEQNSRNSSRPPSSDNPYDKGDKRASTSKEGDENGTSSKGTGEKDDSPTDQLSRSSEPDTPKRSPGRQPGAQGF